MSHRLIFFGNERLATGVTTRLPVLQALINHDYEIAAIVTGSQAATSRRHRPLEVADFAQQHQIPLLTSITVTDIAKLDASLGVLVAYGRMVPTAVIEAFSNGIVNLHPSLLPLHRGPIPLEAAILAGAPETGLSLMKLAPAMDAGPAYRQVNVPLDGAESKQALADRLGALGAEELIKYLPAILDGSLSPQPQDDTKASYDQRLTKTAGQIDWSLPAVKLERQIRAFAGWPGSQTFMAGTSVTITSAHVAPTPDGTSSQPGTITATSQQLAVQTGDGLLIIDSLKPAGSKDMPAQAFLAGHRMPN